MNKDIIVIPEGKICDYIDGKFRKDTPEEYVRQNIEKRLVNEHKYSKNRLAIEYTLQLGSQKPRADIVIFSDNEAKHTQDNISIIIECKKETISPSSKKDGVGQLKSYMASCPNCEWGMWTNGKQKEVFRKIKNENDNYKFLEYIDIPSANGSTDDIDKPKRNNLIRAVEDNLMFVFRSCHNHIYANEGMQKQPAFFELLKIIFCKIEDEKNYGNDLAFYTATNERSNPDGQLTVKKRIDSIFERVKKKQAKIFDKNDEIKLHPRTLAYIVGELQRYSLLSTHIDIKGRAYEELVGANLRGDRGEFFTPRNVMSMVVKMLSPTVNDRVLDPACGTGGFLVTTMNEVIATLENSFEKDFECSKDDWNDDQKKMYQERIGEIAKSNFFGFDLNPDLVKATKMNMVMNNDGSGNIFQNNSLLPPHEWTASFKKDFAQALEIEYKSLKNENSIGYIDIIITNPPFGSKIPIKDTNILEQYDLGHIWQKDNSKDNTWHKTSRLQSSVPPEQLFIERCIQLLKPNGRMGIVLPDSILGSPGLGYIREWLISKTKIIASIDLHVDTFQPRNGTQTSVLILQKKTKEQMDKEEKSKQMADYKIFMAMVEHIGHDKRGNPIFKKDQEGNELLFPVNDIIRMENTVDGTFTSKVESKSKEINDQTILVPKHFNFWKVKEGLSW